MKKQIYHIIFLLIVQISYTTSVHAQVISPQTTEANKSLQTPPQSTTPPNVTGTITPSTTESITQPAPPKKRRRRPTTADSLRLALQRDSIAKAAQSVAPSSSAFNINPASTPTTTPDTTKQSISTPSSQSEVPLLTNSENPFEILRGTNAVLDTNTLKTKTMLEQAAPSLLNRETYSKNFLFWVFLITLSLMSLVVANGRSALRDAYQSLLSNNALRYVYRLQAGWGNITQMALYGLFLLNAGIFVFLMLYRFYGKPPMNQTWTLLFCVLGVCLVFLIKHTILYIISSVFPITKEVKLYNFIIITSGILLGLILLPLNIFIAYSPDSLGNLLVYMTFGVIAFIYLVRSIRSLSVASPFLATNQFHFFVYLCAVEFAPLLVLVKLLISKSPF